MDIEGLPARVRELIGDGSARSFAHRVGINEGTLRSILKGSIPQVDTLAEIAAGAGVEFKWLALGEGPKISETFRVVQQITRYADSPPLPKPLDPELFGRVVERIARVYREEGVRLPDIDLGRIAAERYAEVTELSAEPDEWPMFLEIIANRIRKALQAAAIDPSSVKREA